MLPIFALFVLAVPDAQVIEADGWRIEILGLESMTPAELREAVRERCENKFCAATLMKTLGFAGAAVFSTFEPERRKVVALVETSKLIRPKQAPAGEPFVPTGWDAVVPISSAEAFGLAVTSYAQFLAEGESPAAKAIEERSWQVELLPQVRRYWAFLASHATSEHLAEALWNLERNSNTDCRQVAAAVVMNFHQEDVAWWALVDGLRDQEDLVTGGCWSALRSLGTFCPRRVDWRPAAGAVRDILNGTRLFPLPSLCEVLVRTEVDRDLAPILLRDGAPALKSMAKTSFEHVNRHPRKLLAVLE